MNRFIFGAAICALVGLLPETSNAKVLPMTDAMAVSDVIHEHVPHSDDIDIDLVGEGAYAVGFWSAANGHAAGAALLKKVKGDWQLIKIQPQIFSSSSDLSKLGVPAAQATALIADIQRKP